MNDRSRMVGELAKNLATKIHEDIDRQLAVARFALDESAVSAVHALALQTVLEVWLGAVVLRRRRDLTAAAAFDVFLGEMHRRVGNRRETIIEVVERTEARL